MPTGRNDPCPCGSGKKYKACCGRGDDRQRGDVVYLPQIAPKLRDLERRQAEFWRPLPGQRVACDLCYRRCEIEEGAAGWCKARRNEGARLALADYGVLSSIIREMNGYGGSAFTAYKPGLRIIAFGLTHCTAGCTFCQSALTVWKPDKMHWLLPEHAGERLAPSNSLWNHRRSKYTPEQVVDTALRAGAGGIEVGQNEPTLFIEYTLDVARLAKRAGLEVLLNTNGFTAPAAIRTLAPYVDAVLFGVKGSADPTFYERNMRSPGAVPYVLEAAKTWVECGVYMHMSDLIPPDYMQDDAAAEEAQRRFYGWVHEHLGEHTPCIIGPMKRPDAIRLQLGELNRDEKGGWLTAHHHDEDERYTYHVRVVLALARAWQAGLRYAHRRTEQGTILECHNCAAPLLRLTPPMLDCKPCTMFTHHCPFWEHHEAVDAAGHCKACGVQTPVMPMSPNQRGRWEAWRATADPGQSVRRKVQVDGQATAARTAALLANVQKRAQETGEGVSYVAE